VTSRLDEYLAWRGGDRAYVLQVRADNTVAEAAAKHSGQRASWSRLETLALVLGKFFDPQTRLPLSRAVPSDRVQHFAALGCVHPVCLDRSLVLFRCGRACVCMWRCMVVDARTRVTHATHVRRGPGLACTRRASRFYKPWSREVVKTTSQMTWKLGDLRARNLLVELQLELGDAVARRKVLAEVRAVVRARYTRGAHARPARAPVPARARAPSRVRALLHARACCACTRC
jgi:hypothetical protein